jgi:hypothetical protein
MTQIDAFSTEILFKPGNPGKTTFTFDLRATIGISPFGLHTPGRQSKERSLGTAKETNHKTGHFY